MLLKAVNHPANSVWFTVSKIVIKFLIFIVLILGLFLQKYSTNTKRYPPKKVFDRGLAGRTKLKSSTGHIFLYLLNIFATAAPRLKQKNIKILFQF